MFKRIGRNIQRTGGALTTSAGKGLGGVLGAAAGKSIVSALTAAAPEAAEAAPLLLLKTGGYIRAPRNKPILAILHGGESVLPANAKITKAQKAIIASNKNKKKMGSFVYN